MGAKKANMVDLIGLVRGLQKDAKNVKQNYQSGFIDEGLLVASYQRLPDDKLKGLRNVINKILKDRKIARLKKNVNDTNP